MALDPLYDNYSTVYLEDKFTFKKHYQMLTVVPIDLSDASTFTITPEYEYRPDMISYLFYKTINMEDILCIANKFTDPIKDFYTGRTITIPSTQSLYRYLQT